MADLRFFIGVEDLTDEALAEQLSILLHGRSDMNSGGGDGSEEDSGSEEHSDVVGEGLEEDNDVVGEGSEEVRADGALGVDDVILGSSSDDDILGPSSSDEEVPLPAQLPQQHCHQEFEQDTWMDVLSGTLSY